VTASHEKSRECGLQVAKSHNNGLPCLALPNARAIIGSHERGLITCMSLSFIYFPSKPQTTFLFSRLVRRDKQESNLLSLKKASNDTKVLWQLADQALGKDRPSLPASINVANGPTTTPMEAAEVMNQFFIDKVNDLRKKAVLPSTGVPEETPDVAGEVPHVRQETGQVPQDAAHVTREVDNILQEADNNTMSSRHVPPFHLKFANAKRTSEAIKGLNNTEALGVDKIPTSVLKKGVEILAGPVSHLVNRSLAEG
jgi:hypothetical protein